MAEAPAQILIYEGKHSGPGDSQRYPVDVGPRQGRETGVEIIRHTMGMGDPGREKIIIRVTRIHCLGNMSVCT